jgi:hypothetical protein
MVLGFLQQYFKKQDLLVSSGMKIPTQLDFKTAIFNRLVPEVDLPNCMYASHQISSLGYRGGKIACKNEDLG